MATDKETSILSAINVQGKKFNTMKTFFSNYHVVSSHMIDWLHVLEELVGGINGMSGMWSEQVNSGLLLRLL